jgi:hypothetical protein
MEATFDGRAVIDRLPRLRVILPAMAQDAAAARRQAARLRSENECLLRRIAELEAATAATGVPEIALAATLVG